MFLKVEIETETEVRLVSLLWKQLPTLKRQTENKARTSSGQVVSTPVVASSGPIVASWKGYRYRLPSPVTIRKAVGMLTPGREFTISHNIFFDFGELCLKVGTRPKISR